MMTPLAILILARFYNGLKGDFQLIMGWIFYNSSGEKMPRRGRTTRGKGRRIRGKNMTVNLAIERDPVLANMTRGEVRTSYFGLINDLFEDVRRVWHRVDMDQSLIAKGYNTNLDEYIADADQLTVILRLVDRARDHALELSVRPVEDEVGTDA